MLAGNISSQGSTHSMRVNSVKSRVPEPSWSNCLVTRVGVRVRVRVRVRKLSFFDQDEAAVRREG